MKSSCASYVSRVHHALSINISATASIKSSKYRKCSWLSCWYIQLPVLLPVKKFIATSKWRPFWKFWNIKHSFILTSDIKRSSQIMPQKVFFMVMKSSMTSQGGLKVGPLYFFINEIRTFFIITTKRTEISSLNFLSTSIMGLWSFSYKFS